MQRYVQDESGKWVLTDIVEEGAPAAQVETVADRRAKAREQGFQTKDKNAAETTGEKRNWLRWAWGWITEWGWETESGRFFPFIPIAVLLVVLVLAGRGVVINMMGGGSGAPADAVIPVESGAAEPRVYNMVQGQSPFCTGPSANSCGVASASISVLVMPPDASGYSQVVTNDAARAHLGYMPGSSAGFTTGGQGGGDGAVAQEGEKIGESFIETVDLTGFAPDLQLAKVKVNSKDYNGLVRLLYAFNNWQQMLVRLILVLLILAAVAYETQTEGKKAEKQENRHVKTKIKDMLAERTEEFVKFSIITLVAMVLTHLAYEGILNPLVRWFAAFAGSNGDKAVTWVQAIVIIGTVAGVAWMQREMLITSLAYPVTLPEKKRVDKKSPQDLEEWLDEHRGDVKLELVDKDAKGIHKYITKSDDPKNETPYSIFYYELTAGVRRDMTRNIGHIMLVWFLSQFLAPGGLIGAIDPWDTIGLIGIVVAGIEVYGEFGDDLMMFLKVVAGEGGLGGFLAYAFKGLQWNNIPGIVPFMLPPLFAALFKFKNALGDGIVDLMNWVIIIGLVLAEPAANAILGFAAGG